MLPPPERRLAKTRPAPSLSEMAPSRNKATKWEPRVTHCSPLVSRSRL